MTYVFANWKMYLGVDDTVTLARAIAETDIPVGVQVAVFPNSLSFREVVAIFGETNIAVGAQFLYQEDAGAYTGAISAPMFREAGARYALVGHSERRHVFGETNEEVRARLEACIRSGITPVLCVGETEEDKQEGRGAYRIKRQLSRACTDLNVPENLLIAYEPVWAISNSGHGESCNPLIAEEMHMLIEEEMTQYTGRSIPILYGGSVNSTNVLSYVQSEHIDGVLVGSASTNAASFRDILQYGAETS